MLLVAGFGCLLNRHGGGRDFVIGVPYAGRGLEGTEGLVGYCTHLLPLRLRLDGGWTPDQLLDSVRRTFLDAFEHADYPFAHILEDMNLRRDPARPPLVPVTFNLDRIQETPDFGDGIGVRLRTIPIAHAKFDLACNVVDCAGELSIELDYAAGLFSAGGAERLLDDYVRLLTLFASADAAVLDAAGLETPVETRIREHWAGGIDQGQDPMPMLERFRRGVASNPEQSAIVVDGELRLSRGDLDRWSDAIAAALTAVNPEPGPIALLLPRTEALPAAMLGCWKAGRAYLPIDLDTPPARITALTRSAGCPLVLVTNKTTAPEIANRLALPAPGITVPVAAPTRDPAPDDTAYILFTSGSTGQPKPVAVTHRAVAWYLEGLIRHTGLAEGLSHAVVSTFAADLGLTTILPGLFHGGVLCMLSGETARDPAAFGTAARRWPFDALKIVPSHLESLLASPDAATLLPHRLLILGGETARPSLLHRLGEIAPGLRVMNHYGPTETTVGVTMGDRRPDEDRLYFDAPLAGARIALLDAEGRPVPVGARGEIHIGGAQLAAGYPGRPAETAERFQARPLSGIDGPLYRTGDIGRFRDDGRLEILGRSDDQVKIRGYRVEPGEVAAAIEGLPEIRTAAVAVAEHPVRGRCLVAHVVPADLQAGIDAASLLNRLRQSLPDAMLPTAVLVHDALPLTANGKLDRRALPLPDWTSPDKATSAEEARDQTSCRLLEIWREVFGRPGIGPHDDFFALGGDSIVGIRIAAQLHRHGLLLRVADIYRHPTVAALAPLVQATGNDAEQGLLAGSVPLLPSQHRWLERGGGTAPHANLSILLEMAPGIGSDQVEAAFARLLVQHDGLRLRVTHDGDGVAQHYAPVDPPAIHRIDAEEDLAAAFTRLQALTDPCSQGIVLGWHDGPPARLLIAIHHWLIDALSWTVLLEDFRRLLEDPAAEPGRKTLSLRQWSAALAERAASRTVLEQAEYWTLIGSVPPPPLPQRTDAPEAAGDRQADEETITALLTAEETAGLLHGPATGAGADAEDILLAALTVALGDVTGEPVLYVELEGHGRDLPDATAEPARTIGWFTARYPAWFDLSGAPLAAAVGSVREQRLSIPNWGFDHGLLRWLGPEAVRRSLAECTAPEVSFNYLGRMAAAPPGGPFTLASWRPNCPLRGAERAGTAPRPHRIAVEAMLCDGCLRVDVQYNPRFFDPAVIAHLTDVLRSTIVELATTEVPTIPAAARIPVPLDADDLAALTETF